MSREERLRRRTDRERRQRALEIADERELVGAGRGTEPDVRHCL